MNPSDNAIESTAGLFFLLQLILLFYFDNFGINIIVFGVGWLLLIPSFLLLTLPSIALRSHGGLIDTGTRDDTKLVARTGVYGIIRHPLFAGWMLTSISLALISQSLLSTLCTFIIVPLVLIIMKREEQTNSMKFGEEYSQYQIEVPLLNIFTGIWRRYRRERNS